ncbi:family 43 glycosylhydrolase [Streptomyces sp. NPDC060030]|uniref:family 43 glycosylhydrolase n=1 Tax=Streptomyces sp. NPDC060030 TaxID=3347042 RepID=UPI003699DD4F
MNPAPPAVGPYRNPLAGQRADPHITRHTDGRYYFTATVPAYDRIVLRSSRTLNGLATAEESVIWSRHADGDMAAHIWAPELHHIDGAWYVHFAAAPADEVWKIRIWVLENVSADPRQGTWTEKGQVLTAWDTFSLDAHPFTHGGERYLAWAQHEPGQENNTALFLSRMADPWTLTGPQVRIAAPEHDWERVGFAVNEGPAVLQRNGRVFMTYSASATDANYCVGLLTAGQGSDLMDPASWAKSAAYDDVRGTGEDGTELLSDDFSAGDARWTKAAGRGDWAVRDGAYVQSDESAENTLVMAGDTGWQNYDTKVTATKKAGKEGFLVAFGVKDTGNTYWWDLGGWGNTRSAVSVDGAKQTMTEDTTTIETGRAYDVHIQVRGRQVTLFLDGEQWGTFTDDKAAEPLRQVVTRDDATGDLVVKVVNAQAADARTRIDLGARPSSRTARLTTLQAAPDAVNTADDRQVAPRTSALRVDGRLLTHTFPAHSVTFLRIRQ